MSELVTDKYTLFQGDCLEFMRSMPDKSVDAVITDPPYGIEFSSGMGGKFLGHTVDGDKSTYLRDEMISMLQGIPMLVFGSWKSPRPKDTRHILIWEKGDHVGMGDLSIPWRPNTEEIYIIGSGFSGHRGSSVLRYNAISPNFTPPELRYHPTEKPIKLMLALLIKCPQGIIFDPFMGSGTTGVACMQLGRKFIGCEIDPGYFEIAKKRIEAAAAQMLLPIS